MQTATLPVFFKQRDSRFYPVAAFTLPTTLLRLPFSLSMALPWAGVVYWSVALAPSAGRCPCSGSSLSPHVQAPPHAYLHASAASDPAMSIAYARHS